MTLEEAITTAITYENRVRDVYEDAGKKLKDETGKRVFDVLANEEQSHVDFLERCLAQWKASGKVTAAKLATAIPPKDTIARELEKVEAPVKKKGSHKQEIELLKGALVSEVETSRFYRKVVAELPASERGLFERFVEIEVGHEAIVQAEIDSLSGNGTWFDFTEIDLEAG